jgi:AbiV family abortive infection protein
MTRRDFQDLAEERIRDAEALLKSGQFSGAYYLAGLSVECAIKACIAKATKEFDFPDRDKTKNSYQHDLDKLIEAANLKTALQQRMNGAFGANWTTIRAWDNEDRYSAATSPSDAARMIQGITDSSEGVLPWLRTVW